MSDCSDEYVDLCVSSEALRDRPYLDDNEVLIKFLDSFFKLLWADRIDLWVVGKIDEPQHEVKVHHTRVFIVLLVVNKLNYDGHSFQLVRLESLNLCKTVELTEKVEREVVALDNDLYHSVLAQLDDFYLLLLGLTHDDLLMAFNIVHHPHEFVEQVFFDASYEAILIVELEEDQR